MTLKEIVSITEDFQPKEGRVFTNIFVFNLHDQAFELDANVGLNWNTIMSMFELVRDFKNWKWKTNFVLQQTIAEVVKEYVANTKNKQPDNMVEYREVIIFAISGFKYDDFLKFITQ